MERGGRCYRARGLEKNTGADTPKIQLRASRTSMGKATGFHSDTLDLYAARQRQAFVRQAAEEMGAKEDDIRRDLHELLLALEAEQQKRAGAAAARTELRDHG